MRWRTVAWVIATSMLHACNVTPLSLRGNFANVAPTHAMETAFEGLPVRWGGIVTGALVADNENCLEVAAYPIDTWSFRPKLMPAEYSHSALSTPVQHGFIGRQPLSLFLACSDRQTSKNIYFVGAVVTVTGVIEPAKIYQFVRADCLPRPASPKMTGGGFESGKTNTHYTEDIQASNDDACVAALPALHLSAIHVWREPLEFNPHSPQMGSSP